MYELQEELERYATSREAVGVQQTENGGGKNLLVGFLVGVLLLLGGLEVFTFVKGKGELLAFLQSEQIANVRNGVQPKPKSEQPAKEQAVAEQPVSSTEEKTVAETTPRAPQQEPEKRAEVDKRTETPAVDTDNEDGNKNLQIVKEQEAGHELVGFIGGRFEMGNRSGVFSDELPLHEVALKPFMISLHEVTFEQYDRFAKATGRPLPDDNGWGRGNRPVINVSWDDAQAYVEWISQQTGKHYRLPSEAEWEFSAAGGSLSTYWWGYATGKNNAVCFNCGSSWDGRSTAPVGSLKANGYGLYNTAGNVQEWVQDCYKSNYNGAPADGGAVDAAQCGERVARGSAFNKPAATMRTTKRARYLASSQLPFLGFRIARDL
jgi:formylglycine-generating enzyme required for sulfatase activity